MYVCILHFTPLFTREGHHPIPAHRLVYVLLCPPLCWATFLVGWWSHTILKWIVTVKYRQRVMCLQIHSPPHWIRGPCGTRNVSTYFIGAFKLGVAREVLKVSLDFSEAEYFFHLLYFEVHQREHGFTGILTPHHYPACHRAHFLHSNYCYLSPGFSSAAFITLQPLSLLHFRSSFSYASLLHVHMEITCMGRN